MDGWKTGEGDSVLFPLTEPREKIKIIIRLFGETGENPVRARRREAHIYYLPYRKPQFRDKPLELV